MEEAYWNRFMTTGRVEDYLQFKSGGHEEISGRGADEKQDVEGKKTTEGNSFNAGYCDGNCRGSVQCAPRGV